VDKYYIGTGTINGRKVRTGHTLVNFNGTLEEAAKHVARANPGIEDFELTENGDSTIGMLAAPPEPSRDEDFAQAMMSPPRTVKVRPTTVSPANPLGKPFDPKVGIPREAVPADVYAAEKAKAEKE
jgi:hypothetical protein